MTETKTFTETKAFQELLNDINRCCPAEVVKKEPPSFVETAWEYTKFGVAVGVGLGVAVVVASKIIGLVVEE